jgi:hypothetical protein
VTPTYFFEQYFQWWQSAATRYLNLYQQNPFFLQGLGTHMERYLEIKKLADRMMEETWRNLRLPTLDDMTRLHERLNLLESKLVALQEENQTEEVATHPENLKSLDKSFANRRKGRTQARKSGARVK